jgi:hypothetical protein
VLVAVWARVDLALFAPLFLDGLAAIIALAQACSAKHLALVPVGAKVHVDLQSPEAARPALLAGHLVLLRNLDKRLINLLFARLVSHL